MHVERSHPECTLWDAPNEPLPAESPSVLAGLLLLDVKPFITVVLLFVVTDFNILIINNKAFLSLLPPWGVVFLSKLPQAT